MTSRREIVTPPHTSFTSRRPSAPGPASRTLAGFIFASRWLQAPLYLGLIIAQAVYVVLFCVELWHLFESTVLRGEFEETTVMLSVLALIDVVMIANLLIMVIIGGYETFVSKIRVSGHHDEPDWLSHVNANLLKVKLAVSIISISSIHLLKTFIEVGSMNGGVVTNAAGRVIYSSEGVMWEVLIHLAFIVSAIALAWIDKMSQGPARREALTAGPGVHGTDHAIGATPSENAASRASGASTTRASTENPEMRDDRGYVTVRMPAGAKLPDGAEIVEDAGDPR